MERIFITGAAGRRLRRLARRGVGLALEPSDRTAPEGIGHRWGRADEQRMEPLRHALALGDVPLDVLVPSHESRIRAHRIRSAVLSAELPEGSFERVVPFGDGPFASVLPKGMEVLVESAPLAFVNAAAHLVRAVRQGRISQMEADLRLLVLGMEECSTFALDPWNPLAGQCAFKLPVATHAETVRSYLEKAHGVRGLGMARRVARHLADRSFSPMETLLALALSLPPDWGGMGMEPPELNKEIPLEGWQRAMLNHVDHITPDLLWEGFKTMLEYLGEESHDGKAAQDEDAGRMQDGQVLGYYVFPVRDAHVRTQLAFNRLAARLASVMDERGAHGMRAWVNELVADEDFLALQRVLFKVLRPALHG